MSTSLSVFALKLLREILRLGMFLWGKHQGITLKLKG